MAFQRVNVSQLMCSSLQPYLGPPPVSPLRVVPDFIASLHLNPLSSGTILLLLLGQESFNSENLEKTWLG